MSSQEVSSGPVAIDTDVFSYLHISRGNPGDAFVPLLTGRQLALPFAVVGELWVAGLALSERRQQALRAAIGACTVLPGDARVVLQWARLRAKLKTRLKGEGINDIWIAACCLVHDLPLCTNNLSDFDTIATVAPELRLEHPTR